MELKGWIIGWDDWIMSDVVDVLVVIFVNVDGFFCCYFGVVFFFVLLVILIVGLFERIR